MGMLFDDDLPERGKPAIPGLSYVEDFLTSECELELARAIDSAEAARSPELAYGSLILPAAAATWPSVFGSAPDVTTLS